MTTELELKVQAPRPTPAPAKLPEGWHHTEKFGEVFVSPGGIAWVVKKVDMVTPGLGNEIKKHDDEESVKILDLYLRCYTEQEIADETGIPRKTIEDKIVRMIGENSENGKIANRPETIQDYNLWEFNVADDVLPTIFTTNDLKKIPPRIKSRLLSGVVVPMTAGDYRLRTGKLSTLKAIHTNSNVSSRQVSK